MKSKLFAFLLPAVCGAALAVTLSVAAAEQPLGPALATPATSDAPAAAATSPTSYGEYRNDQWRFALEAPSNTNVEATDIPGGVTVQFTTPDGDELFQVSAWRYQDLVVHAEGLQLLPAAADSDQGDELDTVHYYDGDLFRIAFEKNGIGYTVQTVERNATTTLDILKSWHFI